MAIIGYNTVHSDTGLWSKGWTTGFKFSAPSDGWITDLHMYTRSDTTTSVIRMALWDSTRARVRHTSQITIGTTFSWRDWAVSAYRINSGDVIWLGAHNAQGSSSATIQIRRSPSLIETIREQYTGDGAAADPLAGTQRTDWPRESIYADYTPNAAPLAPVLSSPSSGAIITGTTMIVSATLPHSSAENAVGEYSTNYRIVVQTPLGTDMINQSFNTTSTEQSNGSFSRSISVSTLPPGDYTVKVQHTDSFGLIGSFSALRSFTIPVPPPAPTLVTPLGKINVISGYNYTATYNNPQTVNANLMEMEVYNSTGTTLLFAGSGVVNIAPGGNGTIPEFHADLAWGTTYQWRARFRDANGIYGDWSALQSFNTNSVPSAPTGLVPSAGQVYTSLSFYANISDPDNDTMSGGEIEIRRVSDSVVVHTGTMAVDNGTQSMSQTLAGGILVAGTSYEWRCRVGDQNSATQGKGLYSAWTQFTYSTGASVTRIAPIDRINLVENPRAESVALHGGTYWTHENTVAGAEYTEIQSNRDAPSGGGYVWSSYASANKVYASANRIVGPKHTIDATKPYLLSVQMKRVAGTDTNSTLALRCYSAADADLGLIYPSNGFSGGLNNAHVANKWTRYGGVAGISGILSWPATTAKVRVEITAANAAGAQVLFDAVQLERLPVLTSTEWASIKAWFGYADGASVVDPERNTNAWLGTPYLSASSVPAVLSDTTPSFLIDYVYGIAKKDDRVKIDQWRAGQWVPILDTGNVAGTRELIPLANGALPDASRIRVTLSVRDTTDVEVTVAPFEVDVDYTGPPEILVTEIIPSVERASLTALFEGSTLTTDFGGIEIQRSEDGINFETITRLNDPAATIFEYHGPRSDADYTFRVRQIQRIPGTSYDIYGRWSSAVGSVSYYPNFFIKDVNDPENILGFRMLQVDHAPYSYGANEDRHELGGDTYPTFYMGDPRSQTVEVTMYLGEGHGLEGTVDERWNKMLQFEEDRPTVIFLDSYHDTKWIAQIVGETTLDEGLYEGKRRATFNLEKVDFSEDVTDMEALF